jgi:hypothetical protein
MMKLHVFSKRIKISHELLSVTKVKNSNISSNSKHIRVSTNFFSILHTLINVVVEYRLLWQIDSGMNK